MAARRRLAGCLCICLLWLALPAQALTITQSFMNSTAPGWVFGGSTLLTSGGADPVGNGYLRLTPATTNQAGYAYYNTGYATANGFVIEFEYGSWGGTSADGLVVFLFDAATPTFQIGDFGGSLGYANGCAPTPGLSRAYIGIAFDEFGNFTNPGDRCKNGGPGARPNSVTLRGAGNGVDTGTNYFYLTHNQLSTATNRLDCPSSLCGTTRPSSATYYRQVRITMYPTGGTYNVKVEMRWASGDPYETVINTYTLPTPIYPNLKVGFSASTGGSTNVHEIRNLQIDVFDALADKEATGGFTGPLFAGSAANYQVNVRNLGPDAETGPLTVTSNLHASLAYTGYSGSGWTCGAVGQLVTCTNPVSLPSGSSAPTLTLNVNVSGSAGGSTITNVATVSGAVFDNDVFNNSVSSSRFVYGGSSVGLKSMYMYFNSAGGGNANTLRRVVPTADSLSGDIAQNASTPWMQLTPAFVRPFTINAGTLQVPVCLQRTGAGGGNRNVRVELDTIGGSVVALGGQTINNAFSPNDATWRTITFSIPVAAAVNLNTNTRIRARITNLSTAANRTVAARSFVAACGTGYSRVDVTSSTVVKVESVAVYNATYPGGTTVSSTFDNGATLYLRSVVSDPFGSFDITGADYALFNNANTQVGVTVGMTQVNDNVAAGERTYQTAFTTPAFTGSAYSLRVTAREGTEGTVTNQSAAGLIVRPLPPLISVSKVASTGTTPVAPGGAVGYTVVTTNSGTGAATGLLVRDAISPFSLLRVNTYGALTPFLLTDGPPASGLTLGTPEYSNDNGATWTYVPSSGGGGAPAGYDANVTNFRIPVSGNLPPGRNFTLEYEVNVR